MLSGDQQKSVKRLRKISPKAPVKLPGIGSGKQTQKGWVRREYKNCLADFAASQPITIQNVAPVIDNGRYAVKREVGDNMEVWADIFKDGHEMLKASILYRKITEDTWQEEPMFLVNPGLARWRGEIVFSENTRYVYTIEAWVDVFGTWHDGASKKFNVGQDIHLDLIEGRNLVVAAIERIKKAKGLTMEEFLRLEDLSMLENMLTAFDNAPDQREKTAILLSETLHEAMDRWPDRDAATRLDIEQEVFVDRVGARFAAWYEMFHRSQGSEEGRHATFKDCEKRLPEIAAMGFDVVYLLPIHPVGEVNRKGPNNTLIAKDGDPGSPYAIGSRLGGHKDINPELGTLEDFRHFVQECHNLGMEVAIDFAIQCAPDHPWVKEHPNWFKFRPDGTIKYAENPPKKYEDIVNVDFYCEGQDELWQELKDTVLFWISQGVKIFRVDNPHTKSVPFWEWMIREIHDLYPDVIFLAEAFTKPPMMKMLAKVGFNQSYSYFTWRNDKYSLMEYLSELTGKTNKEHNALISHDVVDYMRPNFFPTTPDILPFFLQQSGRAGFVMRFLLASTLSSVYGIYNGYELCENDAIPGKEEYNYSEKYQLKVWDWNRSGNIKDFITKINNIRRQNPSLHELDNLQFCNSSNDQVIFYGKRTQNNDNMIFIVLSLDPYNAQSSEIVFPLYEMGIPYWGKFRVEELLSGETWEWQGDKQSTHLYPAGKQAQIFRITPIDKLFKQN
ncbi:MAG: alpha-1,4-glucan--maltose-1-phosphate maltosyltransferase [Alphaproteobacteria bacterium]